MAKKPDEEKFEFKKREWQENLVSRVFGDIEKSNSHAIAIGLDMAASEDNWGLSIIGLHKDLTQGNLLLLLPHREPISGFKSYCPMRANQDDLQAILKELECKSIPTAMAVDVPLGWPQKHGVFAASWSAKEGANAEVVLPSRDAFEFRLIDLTLRDLLRKTDPSASVFSVGADKIASAAFMFAHFRAGMSLGTFTADVGFESVSPNAFRLFETYPAAYVRLNYPEFIRYKSGTDSDTKKDRSAEEIRYSFIDRLLDDYSLVVEGRLQDHINQACASSRSDAFDGLLSAFSAWDYLRWRTRDNNLFEMTTPERLLGRRLDSGVVDDIKKIKRIEAEGWILVRSSPLNDLNGGNV